MPFQNFISQDAEPSNSYVTASLYFSISLEEVNHTLILELHDLEAQTSQQYRLPLPELAICESCSDLTVLLPTSTLSVRYPSLPKIRQNSTIPLVIDLILKHAGKYEVVKRVEEVDGSEQRREFMVLEVGD